MINYFFEENIYKSILLYPYAKSYSFNFTTFFLYLKYKII